MREETYPEIAPTPTAILGPVCPRLGLRNDADTHFSFPSSANHCHAQTSPQLIDIEHQANLCFGGRWTVCSRFRSTQSAPSPSKANGKARSAKRTSNWIAVGVLLIVLIMIAAFVIFIQVVSNSWMPVAQLPVQQIVMTATALPAINPSPTATLPPTVLPTASATPRPAPTQTPTLAPTLTPTRALLTSTAAPRPTPTALAINVIARVTLTQGFVLNVRETPSTTGKVLTELRNNALVTIVDGPVEANNLPWWKIDDGKGIVGWAAEKVGNEFYLVPVGWAR